MVSQAQRINELAASLERAYEHLTAKKMTQAISSTLPPTTANTFVKLSKLKTDKPVDHKRWLIGRLYMFAGSIYISCALAEIERNKHLNAQQLCEHALQCLRSSIPHLPQWERSSAIGYVATLERTNQRLMSDKEYALIQLKALHLKVEKHALFVPPEPR
ncbi:MAG: hypothetical protein RMK18_01560 [Armatimonadota bacterium]|nr:hypothetical protein [Armatimonadota bacterium]MCX7776744.1 hypothetical protein [Armatimonadota bacterium]MDW8024542.1 hypothetical protein [Armatimonadota bacterium]